MKYYGKDPRTIIRCLTYGTLLALGLYVVWLLVTMGNIPRPQFIDIAQKGGNIDVLVQALSGVLNSRSLICCWWCSRTLLSPVRSSA